MADEYVINPEEYEKAKRFEIEAAKERKEIDDARRRMEKREKERVIKEFNEYHRKKHQATIKKPTIKTVRNIKKQVDLFGKAQKEKPIDWFGSNSKKEKPYFNNKSTITFPGRKKSNKPVIFAFKFPGGKR